jgi:adenylate kinase family enzyme
MIILITGASHTGKTLLAQKLLEKYKYPYLSMDHVKMGLIRSGKTELTPYDDDQMTGYLWPVICEIIKTAVENEQNLIVEGCYVPAGWERVFSAEYLQHIRFVCLVMTRGYILSHFDEIKNNASAIERRVSDEDFTPDTALRENELYLSMFGGSPGLTLIDTGFESVMNQIEIKE